MFTQCKVLALLLSLLVLIPGIAFAAQSTTDVSVTEKIERDSLEAVLGSQANSLLSPDPYVIGYGDILSVNIFGEGDMAAASVSLSDRPGQETAANRGADSGVKVMLDGRISLKHIGDIEVVGLTLTQLADHLKNLYKTVYAEPIITTTLLQSNSLRYTVMGNVAQPGVFHLDYELTLVQAIARAGGFTEWSNKEMTVVRDQLKEADGKLFKGNTMEFDFDKFEAGKDISKNITIYSGDIIIVR